MTFLLKKKALKRLVSSLTMLTTVVSMTGMMALSSITIAAEGIVDGDLIKSNATNSDGTPTYESLDIYIVKIVGTKQFKRLVLNPTVFESYGHLNYGDVQTIDQVDMNTYVTSSLVRVDTDPDEKVYAMAPDGDIGSKSWLNLTTAEATSVTDYDAEGVYTINETDGGNYNTVGDVTTPTELTTFYADGTLPEGEGTPPVPVGDVSVSLSATTPASGYIVAGQAGARLAVFSFSGSDTVTALELTRSGLSTNDVLTNVYLYEGNTRITDAASVNAEGIIKFSNPSGLFTAPKVIEVRADILSGSTSTTVAVAVSSLTVGSIAAIPVSGVKGNEMNISTTGLALVTLANNQANSNLNANAGTVNQNVWDSTINVGTRKVVLQGLAFKFIGSASTDAVENLSLYVDGTMVGDVSTVESTGILSFDLTSDPLTLNTGNHAVQLRGDFVKGSGRTAQFYVQNSADYMIEDSQIAGAYIIPTTGGSAATNVYGYNFQIQNGTLVLSQDAAFTTTQVVGGASNTTIGQFEFKAYGEDVKVETLVLSPSGTFTGYVSGYYLPNVALYVNGGSVGSSQNWTSGNLTFNPGSNLIIEAGSSAIVEVKADLLDGAGNVYTGASVQVDVVSTGSAARGQSSQNAVTVGNQTGKNLTIGAATVSFNRTGGFFGTTVTPNTADVKLGSFTLSNSNSEDVRVTNVLSSMTFAGGVVASQVSNLRVTDSATIISQPTGADNFSMDVVIPKNSSKIYEVTADIGSVASTSATATATVSAVIAGSVALTSTVTGAAVTGSTSLVGGTGYTSAPAVTVQAPGVVSITSTTGATDNGATAATIAFTGGGCSVQPTAIATIASGVVSTVTLLTPGIGCATVPTAAFSWTGGAPTTLPVITPTLGAQAVVTTTVAAGIVTVVTIGTAGTGYGSAPTLTIAAPTGGTVTTNATVSHRGVSSSVVSTTTATGVAMTVNTATLVSADITKLSSSMTSQLMTGNSVVPSAVSYNVKSTVAPVTVQEMTFTVAPADADHITAITVGGVTKNVTAATGNIVTGLSILIPAGAAGTDIPVSLTFGNVNSSGGVASSTTADAIATLTAVKYLSGNTSTTLSGLSLASNGMQLVGSKPTFTIDTVQKTGLSLGIENKIGEVTVVADAKGNIKINDIKFLVTNVGFTTVPTFTSARIADGSTTIPSSSCGQGVGAALSQIIFCEFGTGTLVTGTGVADVESNTDSDGYTLAAGTAKTFSLYAIVTAANTGTNLATINSSLDSAGFNWDDVNGGGTDLTAANVYNFPTGNYSIKQ